MTPYSVKNVGISKSTLLCLGSLGGATANRFVSFCCIAAKMAKPRTATAQTGEPYLKGKASH